MTGARKFAFDHILPQVPETCTVLDVGAGDGWLARLLHERGAHVTAIDHCVYAEKPSCTSPCYLYQDLRRDWALNDDYDRILAVYSLQHLLGDEAAAWREIRRLLKPDGKAIIVQRYATQCGIETNREDPLNAYNRHGVEALCIASGLKIESFILAEYNGNEYWTEATNIRPNVFCLTVTK